MQQGAGILLQDVQAHLESCDINKNELSSFLGVAIGAGLHVSNGRASLYKCQIHSHDNVSLRSICCRDVKDPNDNHSFAQDEGQGGGLALRYGAHADLVSCNIFSNVFREVIRNMCTCLSAARPFHMRKCVPMLKLEDVSAQTISAFECACLITEQFFCCMHHRKQLVGGEGFSSRVPR